MDRDEYPPAVSKEEGVGSSVRYVPPGGNRSAGAQAGRQLKGLKPGQKFRFDIE
jgi:hypothetical protein